MITVEHVGRIIESLAPTHLKMDWDNIGLQVGSRRALVKKILVTLTVTPGIVSEAITQGVDLIVSHHPIIFRPLSFIQAETPQGAMLMELIKHEIAVYVCHTNLDVAKGGLNDWLAATLGLSDVEVLIPGDEPGTGLGRIGSLPSCTINELEGRVEKRLGQSVRVVGGHDGPYTRGAVCGGSGGDLVKRAWQAGAQVLITGDISYHDALDAIDLGLTIIDAGHYGTEKLMAFELAGYLRNHLGAEVEVIADPGLDPFAS